MTVRATTGTIAFMMGCESTGIEPDLPLVKHKKPVGGRPLKIVNRAVPQALLRLGYMDEETRATVSFTVQNGALDCNNSLTPAQSARILIFLCRRSASAGFALASKRNPRF